MEHCAEATLPVQGGLMTDLDAELMLRAREGDRDAFRQLVERHQRAVVRFCFQSIGDAWEAEDIAQKVFVQVYRSAPRYRATAKFSTWLFTIARNTTLNELRRRQRHPNESIEALSEPTEESHGLQLADLRAGSPSEELQQRELEAKAQEAIRSLPENQRTALALLRHEELSYEEISAVIGCSVSATKSLLHRARETLREKLKAYLHE